MIFTKIELENVGQFRGYTLIELKPRIIGDSIRPIVLFGGNNGAGKTTILQSIMLCMYGRLSLGSRISTLEYANYLNSMIHDPRGQTDKPDKAMICLSMEYTHASKTHTYELKRIWERSSNEPKEEISILEDGKEITNIDALYWQDYINSIFPYSLSSLFLFDGEKIKGLAESDNDINLASSFNSLLGLDLVDQLQKDLSFHSTNRFS